MVKFALLAAVGSTAVAATLGVTSLSLGGFAAWGDYGSIWLTWWLGDAVGALVVTPVLLLWSSRPWPGWNVGGVLEAAVAPGHPRPGGTDRLRGAASLPGQEPPRWSSSASRRCFGRRSVSAPAWAPRRAHALGIAIWGTLHGLGPFAQGTPNESLLLLQAFVGVASVMSLIVAAAVSERRQVEARLRELSVRDPLTGLANYRELIDVLEAEIHRSQRTERSFAFLFLDVDGLKDINDRRGPPRGKPRVVPGGGGPARDMPDRGYPRPLRWRRVRRGPAGDRRGGGAPGGEALHGAPRRGPGPAAGFGEHRE